MPHSRRPAPARAVALLAAGILTLAAGCGGAGTKAGGGTPKTITLKMQAPDGPTSDQLYLQHQVKLRTDGRVRIVLDNLDYTSRYPDNESKLVRDLRSGKVSFAWLPARAWERASPVHVFAALQAPFLVDSYPLLARIATGPIGRSMLRSLASVGIVGLGLIPNELRRPLGRFPLDSLAAFRGARIRVVTSPTSVRDLKAIGAIPLTRFSAQGTTVALAHGKLDGVESELRSILNNYYVQPAPYLPTNLTLFAKLQTVVIRPDALARLSPADRTALRAAVVATARHADPGDEEKGEEKQLCQQGLRLVTATAADLAGLRRAEKPVFTLLERDPATRGAIEAIEALKRTLPADAPLLGPCPHRPAPARSPVGATRFPQGTFEMTVTAADFNARQQVHNLPLPSVSVYVFHDGHFREYTRPVSQPAGGGRYVVAGDVVTLITETPASSRGVHDVLRWSYYRGELTFRVVSVFDSESRIIYSAHPYRRVSS